MRATLHDFGWIGGKFLIQDFCSSLDIFFQNLHADTANGIGPEPIILHRILVWKKGLDT